MYTYMYIVNILGTADESKRVRWDFECVSEGH